jgi:UDP-2,4-diacetamido-2,4,6-trideoxy-beta-L-altropyranose hydrolase
VTRTPSVAARVDADPAIGLGHFKRCVTLLKRLRRDGFTARVITRRRLSNDVVALTDGIPVVSLEETVGGYLGTESADADATLSIIGMTARSWVVLDHYGLSDAWERRVREAGHRLLVIDDYRDRRHAADIVVSDGAAPFAPALLDVPDEVRVLTGREYALIDEDFAPIQRRPSGLATRLMISYGGADPTGETVKAIDAIALVRSRSRSVEPFGKIDVVIGPVNARREAIESYARDAIRASVHFAPRSLAPLMRETDLVLTAGGNTVVEALAMQRPCLVTIVADNQRPMVDELSAAHAITLVGEHTSVSAPMLADAIEKAVGDFDNLARRAREQRVFDHLGAARLSQVMQDAIA